MNIKESRFDWWAWILATIVAIAVLLVVMHLQKMANEILQPPKSIEQNQGAE